MPDEALEPMQEDDVVPLPTECPSEHLDDDLYHSEAERVADRDLVDVMIPDQRTHRKPYFQPHHP